MPFGSDGPGNKPSEKISFKLVKRVPCQLEYPFSSEGWGSKSEASKKPSPLLVGAEALKMSGVWLKGQTRRNQWRASRCLAGLAALML
jgi:hypothetical protein